VISNTCFKANFDFSQKTYCTDNDGC